MEEYIFDTITFQMSIQVKVNTVLLPFHKNDPLHEFTINKKKSSF